MPEGVVRDQPDQLFDPSGVEFVEQVVQQQDRAFALRLGDDGVLRQFEGDQEGFLLSLRAVFAQGVAADAEHQVVAVNARGGELVGQVLLPRGEQDLAERPLLLLDDLFDKLDAGRVEQLIRLVSDETFGQILITDCNPTRLRTILDKAGGEYLLYTVENGKARR